MSGRETASLPQTSTLDETAPLQGTAPEAAAVQQAGAFQQPAMFQQTAPFQQTTSQTVGPYFEIGFAWLACDQLAGPEVSGEKIAIEGRVLDADEEPVPDGVVEIWQANAHGKYAHPEDTQNKPLEAGFKGYGRALTDENGRFRFTTVKPGRVPGPDGREQAPHIDVSVFVRGLLRRLVTRIYFAGEAANERDAVLALVPVERRETLMAKREAGAGDLLRFDIRLSGEQETVFFEV